MIKRGAISIMVVLSLVTAARLSGQIRPEKDIRVRMWALQRLRIVSVGMFISTSEHPIFVPYCSTMEGGEVILCSLASRLERQTSQGWRKVEVKDANLLTKDPREAKGVLIPPHSKSSFFFHFSTDLYLIRPGMRLRIVLDIYPSQEGLRSGVSPTELIGPEFLCPPE
jgi:hypothetical protein